ncbi:MAG TPA: hypothetical protein VGM27_27635 [Acidobacteriaceae bacterium]
MGVSPIPARRSVSHFWNPAAFDYTNSDLSWRPGSEGRHTLFTPGSATFDTSLERNIHIWESQSLDFRFEAFNAFNRPNWNTPADDPRNSATFGVITSAHAMRQLQFALKYAF